MRPTAWQWDGLARILRLAAVLALAGIGIAAAVKAPALVVVFTVALVGLFASSLVAMIRSDRTSRRERAAGYSTIVDAAGFELRNPRTLELERARDEAPAEDSRVPRSLLLGMLKTPMQRLAGRDD